MKIVTDLSKFDKRSWPRLVVALGNFDGVHLGHRRILEIVCQRAREIGGASAVFTFREHPQRVLRAPRAPKILTSLIHKLFLLEQSGIDLCFLIDFSISFSKMSAEAFVREELIETLGAREICMGFNARFGRNREGDSRLMQKLAETERFHFVEAAPYRVGETIVSSSTIRSLVETGRLSEAALLLGRPYSFFGDVVSGSGRGKVLGFPTANVNPHSEILPPEGVYAVRVRIVDCELVAEQAPFSRLEKHFVGAVQEGIMNYGRRPTFGELEEAIAEIHIFNFQDRLYDKTLEVEIGYQIRNEKKFSDPNQLRNQIIDDIQAAKKWFGSHAVRRKE